MFSKMSCAPSLRATLKVTNKMRILWSCAQRVVCCRAWTPFDFCPTCSLFPICVAFVSRSCWRKTSRVSVKIYSILYFLETSVFTVKEILILSYFSTFNGRHYCRKYFHTFKGNRWKHFSVMARLPDLPSEHSLGI